jgi:hypothetical protein
VLIENGLGTKGIVIVEDRFVVVDGRYFGRMSRRWRCPGCWLGRDKCRWEWKVKDEPELRFPA